MYWFFDELSVISVVHAYLRTKSTKDGNEVVRHHAFTSSVTAQLRGMHALPLRHVPVTISFDLSRTIYSTRVGASKSLIRRFSVCLAFRSVFVLPHALVCSLPGVAQACSLDVAIAFWLEIDHLQPCSTRRPCLKSCDDNTCATRLPLSNFSYYRRCYHSSFPVGKFQYRLFRCRRGAIFPAKFRDASFNR